MKSTHIKQQDNDQYRLVIRRGDYDAAILSRLSELLRTSPEGLAARLRERHIVVKSDLDKARGSQMQKSLSQTGVVVGLFPQTPTDGQPDTTASDKRENAGAQQAPPATGPARAVKVAADVRETPAWGWQRWAGIAAVVAACALIAGVATRYWMSTPGYAVRQIVASLEDRDIQEFARYVDIYMLTENYVTTMTPYILDARNYIRDGEVADSDAGPTSTRVSPLVYGAVQDGIIRLVETGSLTPVSDSLPGQALVRAIPIALSALELTDYSIEQQGDVATLTGTVTSDVVNFIGPLQAKLVDEGGWRLIEITNADELVAGIHAAEKVALNTLNENLKLELAREIAASNISLVKATPSDPSSVLILSGEFVLPEGKRLLRTHGEVTISDAATGLPIANIPFLWRQAGLEPAGKVPAFSAIVPNTDEGQAVRAVYDTNPGALAFSARLHGLQFVNEPPRYSALSVAEYVQMRRDFNHGMSN